jgi:hypothetical protein
MRMAKVSGSGTAAPKALSIAPEERAAQSPSYWDATSSKLLA